MPLNMSNSLMATSANSIGSSGSKQAPWTRVYLYTGAADSAPHKPIGDLMDRATFVMPTNLDASLQQQRPLANLVIEEPRLSDEALYKCDVTYVKGKCPSISMVRVQMMALPNRAQIFALDSSQGRRPLGTGSQLGPLNEHEQLRLICLVTGGRPAPRSIFWRKIDASGRIVNLTPTLMVPPAAANQQFFEVPLNHTLTSADLGAKFECHVEHEALDQIRPTARIITNEPLARPRPSPDAVLDLHPAASSRQDDDETAETSSDQADSATISLDSHVIIDLNVGVASLDLFLTKLGNQQSASDSNSRRNSSEPLIEGDLVELECVAYNSKPAANISWLNGQELIGASDELDVASSTPASTSVRRLFSSLASTSRGAPKQVRNKRLLQRQHVQANPDGLTFNTHAFLSVKLSRHEHRAQLSCQAQNAPMRQPLAKSIELQVQHAPIVLMEPAAGIVVNEFELTEQKSDSTVINKRHPADNSQGSPQSSELVQIFCIYSANPIQLLANSVRWFKDGQPLEPQAERLLEAATPNGYPMLKIRRVQRHDAGRYDCQVANSVGLSERLPASESCKLEVNFRPTVQLHLLRAKSEGATNEEVAELDVEQALVLAADELELSCSVLEAQPNRITKFHWFSVPSPTTRPTASSQQQYANMRPLGVTEGPKFKLNPLQANFTPTSFACAATNAIGQSDLSNTIDLRLSYTPGPSLVRPVSDPMQRKMILASSGKPSTTSNNNNNSPTGSEMDLPDEPIAAGRELLLECLTQELGQPRANLWLWFKDGQTIDSAPPLAEELRQPAAASALAQDNPISDRLQDLSPTATTTPAVARELFRRHSAATASKINTRAAGFEDANVPHHSEPPPPLADDQPARARSLASGRYLFIPSIQLAHKGNYSCVAVNRLGSGAQVDQSSPQIAQSIGWLGRESYRLRVALAPSFVQPLAPRTYWTEVQMGAPSNHAHKDAADEPAPSMTTNSTNSEVAPVTQHNQQQQLEFVCHVQCEPICHIEWLRNNEPLDAKRLPAADEFVSYQVRHTSMGENVRANLFKSVESKLVVQLNEMMPSGHNNKGGQPLIDRDKLLERRHFLNSSNFTCQSSSNSIGPSVRSTSRVVVQYPPESVLINAPSDKLNLVEGGAGPLLSCEAQGEPQVQFRWLLLRSANNVITSSDLVAARYNMKHYANLANSLAVAPQRNSNDVPDLNLNVEGRALPTAGDNSQRFVELTSANSLADQQLPSGASVSTLDLSATSLDRNQAGHYICEASNKLGQTRHSVYVNVLYKPTCTTLHMHSLDATELGTQEEVAAGGQQQQQKRPTDNSIMSRPVNANQNDEYSLVRESSDDFIGLRRVLVTSPLFNRYSSASATGHSLETSDELSLLSLKESIFAPVLGGNQLVGNDDGRNTLLIQEESAAASQQNNFIDSATANEPINFDAKHLTSSAGQQDAWSRFNSVLLQFLNGYAKQIKHDESRRLESEQLARRNQVRRSSATTADLRPTIDRGDPEISFNSLPASNERHRDDQLAAHPTTRRLLTFACLAREANPMNNLTFEWHFGSSRLPLADQSSAGSRMPRANVPAAATDERPTLIYANENSTLVVLLTRRLDTRHLLSPFQMSLLTINVISLEDRSPDQQNQQQQQQHISAGLTRSMRQTQDNNAPLAANGNNNGNKTMFMKAPVIKSRYQSFYDGLKANAAPANHGVSSAEQTLPTTRSSSNSNNIQLEANAGALHNRRAAANEPAIDLNEHNWREQLEQLLKCTVANSIGTSDGAFVRLNQAAERLKSARSSSLYEFSKWRVPAQKSLLIISVLIGCALIVFATFALLVGPHLRALQALHKRPDSGGSKDETGTNNTGQSSCSQKSSVMGLLSGSGGAGCGGDSSFQGSSDDDTSARLNQLDSGICIVGNNLQHLRNTLNESHRQMSSVGASDERLVDGNFNGNGPSSLSDTSASIGYDRPRAVHTQPGLIYQPDAGNFNLANGSATNNAHDYINYHYHQRDSKHIEQHPTTGKSSMSSTSSRFLASLRLKPFAKFKVDRISDLTRGPNSLHQRNLSNSETATTGLSSIGNGSGESNASHSPNDLNLLSPPLRLSSTATTTTTPASHNFGAPNFRHSYNAPRRHQPPRPLSQVITDQSLGYVQTRRNDGLGSINETQATSGGRFLSSERAAQLMINRQTQSQIFRQPPNAMDEFMRSRGLDTSSGFDSANDYDDATLAMTYGSHSIRNHSSTLFALRNDLLNSARLPQTTTRPKPPVFPRTGPYGQYQANTLAYCKPAPPAPPPPPVAARSSQRAYSNQQVLYAEQTGSQVQTSLPYSMQRLQSQRHQQLTDFYSGDQQMAYANAFELNNSYVPSQQQQQQTGAVYHSELPINLDNFNSPEHIYDVNAYATPEQTPMRRLNASQESGTTRHESERPVQARVSQLIQNFDMKPSITSDST